MESNSLLPEQLTDLENNSEALTDSTPREEDSQTEVIEETQLEIDENVEDNGTETVPPSTNAVIEQESPSNEEICPPRVEEPEQSPEYLQRKLYFLLGQLKEMHQELPEMYQLRISYELLTVLANTLLNDTIFEIIKGLMEIQHVTEKHLQQIRDQVENEYQIEVQEWMSKILDAEELAHILSLMKIKHAKKLRDTDLKLIAHLDQKVKDQQSTLEKAGVPGFYVTDNPKEIKIQMHLLDFILRLSRIKFEPNK